MSISKFLVMLSVLLTCLGAVKPLKGAHVPKIKLEAATAPFALPTPPVKRISKGPVQTKGASFSSTKAVTKSAVAAPSLWLVWWTKTDVGLEWDRHPDPSVIGYRIYVGRVSRLYDSVFDVGNQITTQVPISPGTTFFAVTAYDSDGLENNFSEEVWTTSIRHEISRINPARPTPVGTFDVESRESLDQPWSLLTTVTDIGSLSLSTTAPMKFFRVSRRP